MHKLLIQAIYPAPYRVELIKEISKYYECDVFFERSDGDGRDGQWFTKGTYYTLDNDAGKQAYKNAKANLLIYSLIILYDYSTKESIQLITKCQIYHVPYAINADGVMLSAHGNPMKEAIKRFLISGARGCLASGKNAKEYFIKYGAKRDRIFLHPFTTLTKEDVLAAPLSKAEKEERRKELHLPIAGRIVIAVGRFIPLKRYSELIRAWKAMPEEIFLLLIGGGELETAYKEIVNREGMRNVFIEPFHAKEELMHYYQAADVFIHPTSYDVWGLVVNEAMANGLPVVVSDHCIAGLELVKDGTNGYLAQMGQEDAFCEKTKQIVSDEKLMDEMGKQAISTIQAYTIENMANAQIHAFQRMIQS